MLRLADLWDTVLSSGSLNILFYLFLVFFVFGVVGGLIYWLFTKFFIYSYNFAIISHSGRLDKVKAKRVRARNGIAKFQVKGYQGIFLDIREPNATVDNKPCRVVAFDGIGGMSYVTDLDRDKNIISKNAKFKVDKELYLQTALLPIEREAIANNIIDSTQKYGRMPAEVKWAFGFAFALFIVVVIGLLIQGKILAQQYSISADSSNVLADASNSLDHASTVIAENTKLMILFLERSGIEANFTKSAE